MLAFCGYQSYESYVVKKKTDKEKDNVIEFASSGKTEGASVTEEISGAMDAVDEDSESLGDKPVDQVEAAAGEPEEPDELELLRREKDKYYDLMLRKQAELENYRKRVFREKEDEVNRARLSLLLDILPVVDACEKGMETLNNETGDAVLDSYTDGYELLLKQLKSFLERNNVSEVAGVGSIFDPNVHEAVLREVSEEYEDGVILEEFRRGYTMNDLLLRAAQVKVAVHPD